jgi:hypothetical protein
MLKATLTNNVLSESSVCDYLSFLELVADENISAGFQMHFVFSSPINTP